LRTGHAQLLDSHPGFYGGHGGYPVRPSQEQGGGDKGEAHDDLPEHRLFCGSRRSDFDEGFQEVNRGDADKGRREFNLEHAGIDVRGVVSRVGRALLHAPEPARNWT
jgi:hypothetical protein